MRTELNIPLLLGSVIAISIAILIAGDLIGMNDEPKLNISEHLVDSKICIENCIEYKFRMFHHNGSSWGTGSSSMSGLSQEKIYELVKKECQEFYKDEKCCKGCIICSDFDKQNPLKTYIHGNEFGACKNEHTN